MAMCRLAFSLVSFYTATGDLIELAYLPPCQVGPLCAAQVLAPAQLCVVLRLKVLSMLRG